MKFEKKILSIDSVDDDKNYQEFSEFIKNHTLRVKNKIASDFDLIGDDLLAEIDEKKRQKNLAKKIYVDYILKHDKNKYSSPQLMSYAFEDVKNIYDEIKNRPNLLQKVIKFIFNL